MVHIPKGDGHQFNNNYIIHVIVNLITNISNKTHRCRNNDSRRTILLLLYGFPIVLLWAYLMKVIQEARRVMCTQINIYTNVLLSLNRYICWWTTILRAMFRPLVSASALTRFIRYIYIW